MPLPVRAKSFEDTPVTYSWITAGNDNAIRARRCYGTIRLHDRQSVTRVRLDSRSRVATCAFRPFTFDFAEKPCETRLVSISSRSGLWKNKKTEVNKQTRTMSTIRVVAKSRKRLDDDTHERTDKHESNRRTGGGSVRPGRFGAPDGGSLNAGKRKPSRNIYLSVSGVFRFRLRFTL